MTNFRRTQTIVSILLFIAVFFLCWYTTGFNLIDIQLSHFGINIITSNIWNISICLLSASIFYNSFYYIHDHTRLRYKDMFIALFIFVSICLFITGAVDMNHDLHDITAYIYFFVYPLVIYLFAHYNRKYLKYKDWLGHVIISLSMIVFPLLFLPLFSGMAIVEIVHTIFVIIWNIYILNI